MAFITPRALALLGILILSFAANTMAVKNIPAADKKQPEWLGHYNGKVLIPGLGCFMVPKKGKHVNPFTYNPITGNDNGNGAIPIGGGSTGAGSGRSYVPGGDDTLLPNPGVEVPNPAGGGIPAPSSP